MAKKRRILLVALLVVVVGGIILLFLRSREPLYQAKPLSYWLAAYDSGNYNLSHPKGPPPPTRDQAAEAVRQMGTQALPILLRMLQKPNSKLEEKFWSISQKQHFIKISYTVPNRHFKGVDALIALGSSASNAVPALIVIFDKNPAPFPQQAVPDIIGWIGPAAREAIPAMLRGTTHTNEVVRNNAIAALGKIHAEPTLVVSGLIKCLSDSNSRVRAHAAYTLGTFGKAAQPAVPALLGLRRKEIVSPAANGTGIGTSFPFSISPSLTSISEDWSGLPPYNGVLQNRDR